ncbi:uncharacterized protein LOC128165256 [Crassostrea angulata]|uniref:uncharacterized protein LOC128165256 n=1 Tax=Magallana angulata TaxID=2784310 RepID=UPI0022B18A49|nr:uncharacterized protein LOC128165256 [Crassostrea angulata]
MRKKQSTTTGGGPPPEVYFKPWELDVLAMIPEELIHGIEGGVDTGRAHETASLSAKSLDPQLSFVVTEVELPDENANAGVPENVHEEKKNTEATMKRGRTGKKDREDLYQQGSEMDELIQIKRFRASIEERRLEIEERKAGALERIASALEKKNR